ncbi:hypothetical protein WA026_017831 [Henosepilachna vigintioctopunctata]|uniref:Uncharacterized protein n=1 Tax=Henosepilachna vigintioctopunctata TaxID=420089 RepID=A0AAW1TVD3_9CUCU
MGLFGSPLADIACFLFFCCSRRELDHLDDLLKLYHEEVSSNLKQLGSQPEKCLPWKACQESFKRYTPMALVGMPQAAKLSCQVQLDKTYDLAEAAEEGNFCKIFDGELRDPEEYFNRINSIFELCIEKGLL